MSATNIILLVLLAYLIYRYIHKYLISQKIKQYVPAEAKEQIKLNKNVVVLDVRIEGERRAGFIKGSINIPVQELRSRVNELEKFKKNEIIVYCRSGNRSLNAASYLSKKGFNVANLKGGYLSWN
ncbi:MAG TPA: rhodanese-like domain-containing protein [Ignavibacteriaceae bacterium]|nr:rhodanese-like domain-containing protein [Ignavibacteriaceae bacterium]